MASDTWAVWCNFITGRTISQLTIRNNNSDATAHQTTFFPLLSSDPLSFKISKKKKDKFICEFYPFTYHNQFNLFSYIKKVKLW